MPKPRNHTLESLARISGISRKTVQARFAQPGAPDRSRSLDELVGWLRQQVSTPVEVPADYADQMLVAKLERQKWNAQKEKEAAEKLRLHNLEKRGQMVEIATVIAQGAAVGEVISSEASRVAKELPPAIAGLDPSRQRQKIQDAMDGLIDAISKALAQLDKPQPEEKPSA
jgi:hypothetical protein